MGGHVLSAVAGLTQLKLMTPAVYRRLHEIGDRFRAGVNDIGARVAPGLQATGVGHLSNIHWVTDPVLTHREHLRCDFASIIALDQALLADGYVSTGLGRTHLNAAMTDEHIDGLLEAIERAVETMSTEEIAAGLAGSRMFS
jgi:glutamate-1-semialdehyde aminotransferase